MNKIYFTYSHFLSIPLIIIILNLNAEGILQVKYHFYMKTAFEKSMGKDVNLKEKI